MPWATRWTRCSHWAPRPDILLGNYPPHGVRGTLTYGWGNGDPPRCWPGDMSAPPGTGLSGSRAQAVAPTTPPTLLVTVRLPPAGPRAPDRARHRRPAVQQKKRRRRTPEVHAVLVDTGVNGSSVKIEEALARLTWRGAMPVMS